MYLLLQLPYNCQYIAPSKLTPTNKALLMLEIWHQNIMGWDFFLCGYTSTYWARVCCSLSPFSSTAIMGQWNIALVDMIVSLLRQIWQGRNSFLHGSTRKESELKHRDRVQDQVCTLYKKPPKLNNRYPKVTKVPLHEWLQHSTTHLWQWLQGIDHQMQTTQHINWQRIPGQLPLTKFFQAIPHDRKAVGKYPPWHFFL